MNHYSFEILNKLVSEIYPFTIEELKAYQDQLDFRWVSRNKNIHWSVPVLREFYTKWDWEGLEENLSVFKSLTIGLFFPDKVELPLCSCSRREDFCEDLYCSINANKLAFAKSLESTYPDLYIKIMMMCDSGFIDKEMIKAFYRTQNPDSILQFRVSL
ncbi:hypothetical protein NE848_09095 [Gramella jeungdoensis]|uniref:Transposase n=1 Tax=Gramella jeungdoensis TaxID=708091 RepID=A0ABT0Z2S8_9FLAO|nr:hypothetical protein [Gramella jeungdoensis]MCM8569535.1 hypothetical protein [Gramella jeungdoensis]